MKKIIKIFAKNTGLKNICLVELDDEIAEKFFIEVLEEEHIKQFYDISIPEDLELNNEELYDKVWEEKYNKIIDKCIEYAKEHKYNDFGSYRIQLVDEDEKNESPDKIGNYTFYVMT